MAFVSPEDLADEFSTFGVDLNEEVTDKLLEVCQLLKISADEIAEQWLAFSHSHKNCKLSSDTLDMMTRDMQNKSARTKTKTTSAKNSFVENTAQDIHAGDEALLDAYVTPSGKAGKKRQLTPDTNTVNKRLSHVSQSGVPALSPKYFSPVNATPSKKYSNRGNSGEVLCSHGNVNDVKWSTTSSRTCSVELFDQTTPVFNKFKYMFQKLVEKSSVLNEQLVQMGDRLREHYELEDFSSLTVPMQEDTTVYGRVCCDSNGKLNSKSVMLEGSRETSGGRQIPVDLSCVNSYSLFPGQVVALSGTNSSGNKFVAKKIYEGISPPMAPLKCTSDEDIHVVVAAGPFTTSDSLCYEPLTDLITYLNKHSPHLCVLMGPFIDNKNEDIENGLGNLSYNEFFQKTMDNLITSTSRDAHHEPVYPQPPYQLKKQSSKRVHMMSDPCTLTVDGVVIGITSTDVLLHLGSEEISFPHGGSDRLSRLTQHLLTQRSYYPLYPPAEDEVCVDYELWEERAGLSVTPHVMLLPSDLRYFIKTVNGACCVNPGRLAKGQVAGSFAHLVIKPGLNNSSSPDVMAKVIRI